jgi:hypothetical protein
MASESESVRWTRLEPHSRDKSLAPGLEARVHDPLWLLGRQWQFGELNADADLGSAIVAELSAQVVPLTRYRPGRAEDGVETLRYEVDAQPLETLVEAEDVQPVQSVRARARAGQHFERLLAAHGVGKYAGGFRAAFPLLAAAPPLDASSRRFTAFLAGRAIDGARLHDALLSSHSDGTTLVLPASPVVDDADAERVRGAATAWLAWFDSLVLSPRGRNAAWVRDRFEYAFAVDAPSADGTGLRLEAEEYTDGTLDWHTFSAAASNGTATAGDVEVIGPRAVVPTTVTYPGMPASRLWEFEDARVDFGGVEANPEDLGRMLVTEFALVYGGDWLLVPLEVAAGSLVRIISLDVRDTFGRTVRVGPTTSLEPPTARWRMFGISPWVAADAAGAGTSAPPDVLLVAPALASSVQGRAIEDVLLLRDEMVNMAWAVERSVEGAHGLPVDRAAADYERQPEPPPPSGASDTLTYRLRTDVPHHWLPLLPQRLNPNDPSMTLRLGALPSMQADGTVIPIRPLGRLLAEPTNDAVVIREEEVPREGARVIRAYQLARWFDGTTFLWLGRRKSVGAGEGSSGLRFDVAGQL